jgi:hypothetical protein
MTPIGGQTIRMTAKLNAAQASSGNAKMPMPTRTLRPLENIARRYVPRPGKGNFFSAVTAKTSLIAWISNLTT